MRLLYLGSTVMCATVCMGGQGWQLEAIGKGETRLVFKSSPRFEWMHQPARTVEYQIRVE